MSYEQAASKPLDPTLTASELDLLVKDQPALHARAVAHPNVSEPLLRHLADNSPDRGARAAARQALSKRAQLPEWQKYLMIVAILAVVGGLIALAVIFTSDEEENAAARSAHTHAIAWSEASALPSLAGA